MLHGLIGAQYLEAVSAATESALRWRAEQLLADMHQIRLYQTTWADAQRLMHHWGAWGQYDGPCTTSARAAGCGAITSSQAIQTTRWSGPLTCRKRARRNLPTRKEEPSTKTLRRDSDWVQVVRSSDKSALEFRLRIEWFRWRPGKRGSAPGSVSLLRAHGWSILSMPSPSGSSCIG